MIHEPVAADHVVVVDDDGARLGTFDRAAVHTAETPLHLAFSCYLLDGEGRLLVTRRALIKRTWPGVWTNSFCGHPRWSETVEESIDRHAAHELNVAITDLRVAVPTFRYRAIDASGVVENEICPVYLARYAGPACDLQSDPEALAGAGSAGVVANPDEVMDLAWVQPADLRRAVELTPWAFSPWMVLQLGALREAGALG